MKKPTKPSKVVSIRGKNAKPGPTVPDKRQCTAHNRAGKRCGKTPIVGGTVCRLHGGAAPQVAKKAAERLADMVDPALTRLLTLLTSYDENIAMRAVRDVLDRNNLGGKQQLSVDVTLSHIAERLLKARTRVGK